MIEQVLNFFTDPIFRAPTIGSMLMCLSAALTGVIVFLRKESLIGEALSHATYPGVIIGILIASLFSIDDGNSPTLAFLILLGAFCSAMAGLWCIHFLTQKMKISSDAALCFILSSFFGIGLTLASRVQFTHPHLYKQIQVYLYGQAATMTDVHILIYGVLSLILIAAILLLNKEILAISLDREYAKSMGIPVFKIDLVTFVLIVSALVIGIRSVGVILMSAMLIAPAAAARQYTNRLPQMFALASLFGLISGFFGNYLSVKIGQELLLSHPESKITLPTGPMIVMVAAIICIASLFFAPNRGVVIRGLRIAIFRHKCLSENILKLLWRSHPKSENFSHISRYLDAWKAYLFIMMTELKAKQLVQGSIKEGYRLTDEGYQKASKIVRLHRLWEVYLADYLDIGAEKVHRSAEEMEHIITPELEEELTKLLNDPKEDPHHQPIPPKG